VTDARLSLAGLIVGTLMGAFIGALSAILDVLVGSTLTTGLLIVAACTGLGFLCSLFILFLIKLVFWIVDG